MKYVIFDLDNCLAHDAHRIPLIDWTQTNPDLRYAAYHAACGDDEVGNYSVYADNIRKFTPIFLTARPASVLDETRCWMENNLGATRETILLMRPLGDRRHSVDLKRDQLAWLARYDIFLKDIVCAYDDRLDVVEMYRAAGITAHALKLHDVCAYTPPANTRVATLEEMEALDALVQGQTARRLRAPDLLAAGAETFRARNAVYGDNYLQFGALMLALFPKGLHITTEAEFTRLGLLVQCAGKLSRYANNPQGHQDSAHDLMVYAAMLEEVTSTSTKDKS
jgi:hypothetical protein